MKQYFTRLIPFIKHDDVTKLFKFIDDNNLTDAVVMKVGAIPLSKFQNYSESQQLALYQDIKNVLVTINQG